MKRILVTVPMDEEHRAYIISQAEGCREQAEFTFAAKESVSVSDLRGKDVLIGECPADVLKNADSLKWVQLPIAGANLYVAPGVLADNCVLTNASGAYDLTVSEHMVALCFALVRRLEQYARNQARCEWRILGEVFPVEGSSVLVLGAGNIGRKFAGKMKALGAYTIGVKRHEGEKPECFDELYTFDRVDELLPRADIVAMVLPENRETEHFMDERRLRLMKKNAIIVNDGRGSTIDSEGLKRVLKDGHLFGAALDVTEPEPLPEDDELWRLGNVIITPHSGGQFLMRQTYETAVRICGENLRDYLNGYPLKNIVSRDAGY